MRRVLRPTAAAWAFLIIFAGTASAQETLTLDGATGQALAHNAALRAVRAGSEERQAQLAEARAGWLPRLTVAETWDRGDQPVFVFSTLLAARRFGEADFAIEALNHPDAVSAHRLAVGVRQPLFDPGQRAAVERARVARDLGGVELDDRRAALAVATAGAYGRALAADAGRRAIEGALAAARADRARTADRRDAGLALDADVLALDAHVAALDQRLAGAAGDAAIARAELNRLIGAPLERAYRRVDWAEPPQAVSDDLPALLAEADRAHPAIRRAAAGERLARADRSLARAAFLPRVQTHGGIEVSGLRPAERASSWLVGAEVAWNLSLGGGERARLRAAASAGARAAAEADDARAGVHLNVVTALTRRRVALARIAAGAAAVDQARETERHVRDRYEAGLAGLTDLLRAQGAVLEAEAQRTAARVDAVVSAAELSRALGRLP